MKKLLLLLLVAFCASFGYAQEVKMNIDIDSIDEIDFCESVLYNKYKPEYTSLSDSIKLLLITRYFMHYTYEYKWMHNNLPILSIKQYLKLKKGTCISFATIFIYIATRYNIITQYVSNPQHAWNSVIYNNKAHNLDMTHWCKTKNSYYKSKPYHLWEIFITPGYDYKLIEFNKELYDEIIKPKAYNDKIIGYAGTTPYQFTIIRKDE